MRNMDKVAFPYRSATHLAFLHVVGESGAWAKHGLDVDYNRSIAKDEAHHAISSGAVEFVGGNHISTYGKRARGDNWVYVGQTLNAVHCKLAVRPDSGINSVADLKGKKIGIRGAHPALNDWLFLKQRGLDVDRGDVELVRESTRIGIGGRRRHAGRAGGGSQQAQGARAALALDPRQACRCGAVDVARPSVRRGRGAEDHRPRAAADDLVHHHLVEPELRREKSRHRRALPEGPDRGRPLHEDASPRRASRSSRRSTPRKASSITRRPPGCITTSRRWWTPTSIRP